MVTAETLARRVVAGLCFTVAVVGTVGLTAHSYNSGQHPQVRDFMLLLPLGAIAVAGTFALTGHLVANNAAGYVQRRIIGSAFVFTIAALFAYGAVAEYVRAFGSSSPFRWPLDERLFNVVGALAICYLCTRVAGWLATAARDGMYLVGVDLSPASPDTVRAFMHIVNTVKAFGLEQRRDHQAIYDAYESRVDLDGPAEHAINLAERSGRVVHYDRSTAWVELDEIKEMVGGSSDVALAVLVRDLLTPADFNTLTRWWTQAGLPLPEPAADTSYLGDDEDGLPIHQYEDGKRSDPYHPIRLRQQLAELAHVLALRGFWMCRALTNDLLKPWHRAVLVKRYNDTRTLERDEAVMEVCALALVSSRLAEAGGNPDKLIGKDEFVNAVALALLVRDLLGDEDRFRLITAHWVAEDLPADVIGTQFPQQAIGVYRDAAYCMTCAITNIPNIADGVLIGADDAQYAGSTCVACGETLPGDPDRIAAVPTGRITSAA